MYLFPRIAFLLIVKQFMHATGCAVLLLVDLGILFHRTTLVITCIISYF